MASKTFAIIAGVGPGTVRSSLSRASSHTLTTAQGASIARRFAKAYSVVLLARNPASYETVVEEINSGGGQAVGISTDLSDSNSVKSAFDQIATQYSGSALAAAVFNSGGGFTRKPFLELTEEDFSSALASQAYICPPPIYFFKSNHKLTVSTEWAASILPRGLYHSSLKQEIDHRIRQP
jgi:hypothetical protein